MAAFFQRHEIRAVLFDLDNTLVDRQSAMVRYCDQFVSQFAGDSTVAQQDQFIKRMIKADDFGYASRNGWAEEISDCLRKHNIDSKIEPDELLTHFFSTLPTLVQPDTRTNLLVAAIADLLPVAIVTNGRSPTQHGKITHAELDSIVKTIIVSDEVGSWKPDRKIFEQAIKQVHIAPENIIMIGDDEVSDIAGASALGIKTCWISMGRNWQNPKFTPDFTINSFNEFESLW